MKDSQPESFISEFHLPSRRKIRRKLMFMPDTASTSAGATVLANDNSGTFLNNQPLADERHPDHSGSFIHEQPAQSEILMEDSQLQSFSSRFHLPSRRKIRRKLIFMADNPSTSISANVLPNDSSVSFLDQQPLPNAAQPAHSEDAISPIYLVDIDGA